MPAKLIRGFNQIKPEHQNGVAAIGNFDGVHLGHQALIQKVIQQAKVRRAPSIVITFEPHPFEFFQKEHLTIPRLTRLREKFTALSACGVDYILILKFNQQLAETSASDFVAEILHHRLRLKELIVGDDFRFGRGRLGDLSLLQSMGETLGFEAIEVPAVQVDGVRISSTRIRQALEAGDHVLVERLLGHPYFMQGRVRSGDQLGRKLGFPTANIFLHRQLTPVKGIYFVYVHDLADHPLPGAANVGTRPTIGGTRTLLEVHLLDFNKVI